MIRMRSRITPASSSRMSVSSPPVWRAVMMATATSSKSWEPMRSAIFRSAVSNCTPRRSSWSRSVNSNEIGCRLSEATFSSAWVMLNPAFRALLMEISASSSCSLNFTRRCFFRVLR